MSNIVTPVWTDTNVLGTSANVIGATTIKNNGSSPNIASGTLDLRTAFGAELYIALGRKGATAPGSAISVLVRRSLDNAMAGGHFPVPYVSFSGTSIAGNATTIGNADANSGQAAVTVASTTGFARGDVICLYDAAFSRLEFQQVSKVAGTTNGTVTLDANLQFTHTSAAADNVTRYADLAPPIWLAGGSLYEVVVDYNGTSTGSDYVVVAAAQVYTNDSIV